MYKIPIDFKIKKLLNSTLNQVCFSSNCISLFFEENMSINIWGGIKISIDNQFTFYEEIFPIRNDLGINNFIDSTITNLKINDNREILQIFFGQIGFIELIGNENFESFQVSIGIENIIV